jgi:ABC-2 type transport system ATP-binding protein
MEESVVKVEHLSHRYSTQWAIRDINFEIKQRGVVGLLGSNGAGKSTTMNIICGVLNQTEGEVYINGISLKENPVEAKRYIGFLPQRPPLYGDLNVDEYLTYCANLRLMDKGSVKQAVEDAKRRCGISHFSHRLIRNLSGGYQQRVGIAQAIVHNPKFVVLDEPTNGLDPNQIVEIRELVKEIAQDHSVLLSTHILSEVQATCEYIRMIEHGNVVFTGTMDDFDNYITPDTFVVSMSNQPALSELQQLPGILEVSELGNNRFRFHFNGDREVMQKMIEWSVSRNWGLSEITLEKISLDEIFAQLSGKRKQKA